MSERTVEFDRVENPTASVIVLAWRLADELIECLAALQAQRGRTTFEVVIVMNGAAPEVVAAIASSVAGATVIDGQVNVGYGRGCNLGVSRSRGEYLVFLNDDARVTDGWLDALVDTARADRSLGAVASVLLNADGTVQEAGSRMLADCTTVAFAEGRTVDDAAPWLVERAIDFGSGAALLVDAALFRDLGGFDPAYYPAYFEDVDLAFRMRAAGRPVLLQPSARAFHIGRASTSRDGRFQQFASERGRDVFEARWADVLASAPAEDAPIEQLCPVEALRADRPVMRSEGLDLVETYSDPVESLRIALEFSGRYAAWLGSLVDESNAKAWEAHVRESEITERLRALEARGPLGVAQWQVGLWSIRHPAAAARLHLPKPGE